MFATWCHSLSMTEALRLVFLTVAISDAKKKKAVTARELQLIYLL